MLKGHSIRRVENHCSKWTQNGVRTKWCYLTHFELKARPKRMVVSKLPEARRKTLQILPLSLRKSRYRFQPSRLQNLEILGFGWLWHVSAEPCYRHAHKLLVCSKQMLRQVWWCTPLIPALKRQGQEDLCESGLDCSTVSSRMTGTM